MFEVHDTPKHRKGTLLITLFFVFFVIFFLYLIQPDSDDAMYDNMPMDAIPEAVEESPKSISDTLIEEYQILDTIKYERQYYDEKKEIQKMIDSGKQIRDLPIQQQQILKLDSIDTKLKEYKSKKR